MDDREEGDYACLSVCPPHPLPPNRVSLHLFKINQATSGIHTNHESIGKYYRKITCCTRFMLYRLCFPQNQTLTVPVAVQLGSHRECTLETTADQVSYLPV